MQFPGMDAAKMKNKFVTTLIWLWWVCSAGGGGGSAWAASADNRIQNFLPTENSNLEVLKELGVDIQHEGRTLSLHLSAVQGYYYNYQKPLIVKPFRIKINLT
jgi:hypothetical protein